MGWAHAVAGSIKNESAQERGRAPQPAAPRERLGRKLGLHRRKQPRIENGLVLAAVNLATVDQLAGIEAVLEQIRERPHAEDSAAVRQPPRLTANSPEIEVLR